jgi:hypothetical protein
MSEELKDIAAQIAALNLQWSEERKSALGSASVAPESNPQHPPQSSAPSKQPAAPSQLPAESSFNTFTAQEAPSSFYHPVRPMSQVPVLEEVSVAPLSTTSSVPPFSTASIRRAVPPVPISNQVSWVEVNSF